MDEAARRRSDGSCGSNVYGYQDQSLGYWSCCTNCLVQRSVHVRNISNCLLGRRTLTNALTESIGAIIQNDMYKMICTVEPNIKSLRNRCEASKFLEASLWFHFQYSGLYRLANLWTRTQLQKEYITSSLLSTYVQPIVAAGSSWRSLT